MAVHTESIQVGGIRCERCVMRLGKVLESVDGIESATANLMGEVTLSWDDQRTDRESILAGLARGGFHELAAV
jgi:copper chaperone CopZ